MLSVWAATNSPRNNPPLSLDARSPSVSLYSPLDFRAPDWNTYPANRVLSD